VAVLKLPSVLSISAATPVAVFSLPVALPPRALIPVAVFSAPVVLPNSAALACEQVAVAVRYTSSLSYGQLKLMPWWDPLRGDPCFEQIVASLEPK
jgi:hypothetical protein